jgi:hypothetical protein
MTNEISLTLTLSRQGRENYKVRLLRRPDKSGLLAMTREVKILIVALSFCTFIFAFCISEGSTKAEAGYHVQVVAAYPTSLEMIIATSSHHSSIIST